VGSATLTYDANGNLLSDGINAYAWNARNQLAAAGTTRFLTDAFGRRVRRADAYQSSL